MTDTIILREGNSRGPVYKIFFKSTGDTEEKYLGLITPEYYNTAVWFYTLEGLRVVRE